MPGSVRGRVGMALGGAVATPGCRVGASVVLPGIGIGRPVAGNRGIGRYGANGSRPKGNSSGVAVRTRPRRRGGPALRGKGSKRLRSRQPKPSDGPNASSQTYESTPATLARATLRRTAALAGAPVPIGSRGDASGTDAAGGAGFGIVGGGIGGRSATSGDFGGRAPGRGVDGSGGEPGSSTSFGGASGSQPPPTRRWVPGGQRNCSVIVGVLGGGNSGVIHGIHGMKSGTRAIGIVPQLEQPRSHRFRILRIFAM